MQAALATKQTRVSNVFASMQIDEDDLKAKNAVHRFLEHPKVQLFLLVVTLYALFADDFRYLTTEKEMDIFYDVFIIICVVIFGSEIVLSCFFKRAYFNSYYFYLDVISTASLILDFTPVKNGLIVSR